MEFFIATEGEPLNIGFEGATIAYYGSEIELYYETQPPHGDAIFSVKLPILDIDFDFWIYGRNLIFLDAHYLLAERVKKDTWSPITSVIINIHTGKYASLGHWYNVVSVREKEVELKNEYDGNIFILNNVDGLEWRYYGNR
jgi:conserved domain protein